MGGLGDERSNEVDAGRQRGTRRQGWATLAWLLTLYAVQGIPFGYQTLVLPIQLRQSGMSLTAISLAAAMSLPWSVKFLWSPLVDGYGGPGRRKLWILPLLASLCLVELAVATYFTWSGISGAAQQAGALHSALPQLLAAVFFMNLLSATLDIAVDGLAIDSLREEELGLGNSAQVVGFKLGMFLGGPAMRMLVGPGLAETFFAFACATVPTLCMTLLCSERRPRGVLAAGGSCGQGAGLAATARHVACAVLQGRGSLIIVIFVATYKAGEQIADTLFKPFVVDRYSAETALWLGTYSLVPSLGGSVAGGALVSRFGILRTLTMCCLARTLAVVAEWAVVLGLSGDSSWLLLATSCFENVSGGALTTATFAFMMASVDKAVGASHYTFLAAVEVLGKLVFGQLAGPLADSAGYAVAFGAAAGLSMAHLVLIPQINRAMRVAKPLC